MTLFFFFDNHVEWPWMTFSVHKHVESLWINQQWWESGWQTRWSFYFFKVIIIKKIKKKKKSKT